MSVSVQIPDHVGKEWCDRSIDYGAVPQFRKVSLTRAIRMAGPFTVETSEGPLRCEDGWLCFDARGYPYPVAAEEFALIYEPAEEGRAKAERVGAVVRDALGTYSLGDAAAVEVCRRVLVELGLVQEESEPQDEG